MDTFYFSSPPERSSGIHGPKTLANQERCYMSVALFVGNSLAKMKQLNLRTQGLIWSVENYGMGPGHEQLTTPACISENKYLRFLRTEEGLNNYAIIEPIGEGGFGLVKLVRRKQDGRVYALKQISKERATKSRRSIERMCAERCALVESDSEWIVKLYTAFQDDTNFYFLLEYLPGGDLSTLLAR
ncbi:kinase-like domain-containing protein [Chaetomium fimeti]|uniref:non-specific serine/threonine protein kinase n=1 Tax=Chaetomium fimeti TaxID=1854472 RepID=A0AAE0HIM4_9PEZI|nr:kinase-like domain-containing protein [Chaetomium fimeti]